MFTPETYGIAVSTALVSTVCWGSWSVCLVLSNGMISFEGFYVDMSIGIAILSTVLALTLGLVPGEGAASRTFFDDFDGSIPYDALLEAAIAGVIFNIANIGLSKSITLVGLAVAFPLGIGTALVVGTMLNYALHPEKNDIGWLVLGMLLALAAICCVSVVQMLKDKELGLAPDSSSESESENSSGSEVEMRPGSPSARQEPKAHNPSFARKIALCIASGLLMGFWSPLVTVAMKSGMTPYMELLCFSYAILLSTFVLLRLFLRCPLEGGPAQDTKPLVRDYRKASCQAHFLGLLGGMIWDMGAAANAIAGASTALNFATSYGIGQAAPMMGVLWGLLYFQEFAGTSYKVKLLLALVLLLFVTAIVFIALSATSAAEALEEALSENSTNSTE
eukprot:TRINITY_DN11119_c0_g1_i1.p1 TRINITY_DN11119_c0_g1~~TRINITY_DN11119_c0_g1_i1.p1  ORF type:complete len:392 (-),score=100.75 TRINITY_DN11119_c0_g1_i1:123-1298(-)